MREDSAVFLSRLTFTLVTIEGRLALAIGGLQGPKAGHKRRGRLQPAPAPSSRGLPAMTPEPPAPTSRPGNTSSAPGSSS